MALKFYDVLRVKEIISIVGKYGLYEVAYRIFPKFLPVKKFEFFSEAPYVRLRKALEELGPTFIKLGQILSLRPDLLPIEYIHELAKLQDNVDPLEFSVILDFVKSELKDNFEQIDRIEEKPLASGSIGQVHKAYLKNGKEVVIKIRRPDIGSIIEYDCRILNVLSGIAEKRFSDLSRIQLTDKVRSFCKSIKSELNLEKEGLNIDRFSNYFKNEPQKPIIPRVYWQLSTENILTMDFIKGQNLARYKFKDKEERKKIAKLLLDYSLVQIFNFGYFHSDPHPGNIIVLKDNIAYIDFGQMGFISDRIKELLLRLLLSIINRDVDEIFHIFISLDIIDKDKTDKKLMYEDISLFIQNYYKLPLSAINLKDLFGEIFELTRKHNITFPRSFVLLIKNVITLDGILRDIYPEFNFIVEAKKHTANLVFSNYNFSSFYKNTKRVYRDYADLLKDLPDMFRDVFQQFMSNETEFGVNILNIKQIEKLIERGAGLVSIGLITASLVIGSSLIVLSKLKLFGIIGFIISFFLSIYILIELLKTKI